MDVKLKNKLKNAQFELSEATHFLFERNPKHAKFHLRRLISYLVAAEKLIENYGTPVFKESKSE